jgi:hypothetical protein
MHGGEDVTNGIRNFLVVSLLVLVPAIAQAGPPLLCFPMSIDAPSLPWGTGPGWKIPQPGYDLARLTDDTLALLGPGTPVLVRMETLRRAAIYASSDPKAMTRLIEALRTRAGRPEDPKTDALALFDLGYFVETARQARHGLASFNTDPPEDGYALVRAALARRGTDPAMEYAAALVTTQPTLRAVSDRHLRAALDGALPGSDLAATISAHKPMWGDRIGTARANASR